MHFIQKTLPEAIYLRMYQSVLLVTDVLCLYKCDTKTNIKKKNQLYWLYKKIKQIHMPTQKCKLKNTKNNHTQRFQKHNKYFTQNKQKIYCLYGTLFCVWNVLKFIRTGINYIFATFFGLVNWYKTKKNEILKRSRIK